MKCPVKVVKHIDDPTIRRVVKYDLYTLFRLGGKGHNLPRPEVPEGYDERLYGTEWMEIDSSQANSSSPLTSISSLPSPTGNKVDTPMEEPLPAPFLPPRKRPTKRYGSRFNRSHVREHTSSPIKTAGNAGALVTNSSNTPSTMDSSPPIRPPVWGRIQASSEDVRTSTLAVPEENKKPVQVSKLANAKERTLSPTDVLPAPGVQPASLPASNERPSNGIKNRAYVYSKCLINFLQSTRLIML